MAPNDVDRGNRGVPHHRPQSHRPGGRREPVRLAELTPSSFRVTRVAPQIGRPLFDEDARVGAPAVVVIGHDVWRSRFDLDPAVIGRGIRLGNIVHTVVGVMPEGFAFPINHSYWVPLRAESYEWGTGPAVFVFGRLAPGKTMADAQAELTTIGRRNAAAHPETHGKLSARVLPYAYPILDIQDVTLTQVGLFQATVSLLLIVVAVNVAVLVYARTATRQGEIAVRTAIGASRSRIVLQLFIEALVLSSGAALVGLGLAKFGLSQAHLIIQLENARPPYWIDYGLPGAAVTYVVVLVLLAAFVTGVLPALSATGPAVQSTLRLLGGSSGMHLGTTWTVLVVAQVALAVAALPVAIMLAWSEVRSVTTKPAFPVEQFLAGVYSIDPEPPPGVDSLSYRRESISRLQKVRTDLLARLEAESWLSDATFASRPPGQESAVLLEVEGVPITSTTKQTEVDVNRVDLDFFDAVDARLLTGRRLTSVDRNAVLINRALVEKVFGNGDAVGHRVRYASAQRRDRAEMSGWFEIVGVVSDLHTNTMDPELAAPVMYHPLDTETEAGASVVLRVSGDAPSTHIVRLRELMAAVDPTVRLNVYPLIDIYRQATIATRLLATAISLVILSVLLLSAAGIYALMSFTVSQRRKEIGIRTALGADPTKMLASVFARSARQLTFGVAAGVAIAILIDVLRGGEMLGRGGFVLLPMMSGVMLIVGLLASIGPARRGLRIQPTQALRED